MLSDPARLLIARKEDAMASLPKAFARLAGFVLALAPLLVQGFDNSRNDNVRSLGNV